VVDQAVEAAAAGGSVPPGEGGAPPATTTTTATARLVLLRNLKGIFLSLAQLMQLQDEDHTREDS